MPAPSDTDLIEFMGWSLRIRPGSTPDSRCLLLVHGWTGDENSMWVFASGLPKDYWILSPRAPHATRPSGFSWRKGSPTRGEYPSLEDLRPAVESLISMLDGFGAEQRLTAHLWSVVGFSQGAALTAALAVLHPERVDRLGLLAGFMPREAEALVRLRPLHGKRVFLAHGTGDEMVDIESGRQAARLFHEAGAQVTACEDAVGHKVSARCMRELTAFLA